MRAAKFYLHCWSWNGRIALSEWIGSFFLRFSSCCAVVFFHSNDSEDGAFPYGDDGGNLLRSLYFRVDEF